MATVGYDMAATGLKTEANVALDDVAMKEGEDLPTMVVVDNWLVLVVSYCHGCRERRYNSERVGRCGHDVAMGDETEMTISG